MTQRTKMLLGGLGLVGALGLWLKLGDSEPVAPPPARAAARFSEEGVERPGTARSSRRGRGSRNAQKELVTVVEELEVARLEAGRGAYSTGRDLFSFYVPPPPPPPKPRGPTPAELAAARQAAEEAARRQAEYLAANPPKPTPPAINVTYIGSFGPPSRRVAVFSNGETLYNALEGDVIEGKFRLVSIGLESVELAYVDFPDLPSRQLPVGQEGV